MEKILVKLYVPKIEEKYDIWIPTNRKIYSVIDLLVKAISEFSGGYYLPENRPILYNKLTAKAYNINMRVYETSIKNGTELILV